ncbi:hypothetical protein ABEB36_010482 [Hypothenemus hampei]|uniref:Uncharacterized protein n=1 Tax=Hypothenemus hampei TaxID=57062 RepID=A0ABD1EKC2_HYPHA
MRKSISKCKLITFGLGAVIIIIIVIVLVWFFLIKAEKPFKGAIVTNGYGCSDIGMSIFEKGGSVADVAIATLFCEGVSLPQSMGLGGGFLMTIYERDTGTVKYLNARETAPLNSNETMFNGDSNLSQKGGLAVAVPGELKGYWYLYQQYGSLPWSDLIQPTIDICKNGIYVTAFLAKTFANARDQLYADLVLRESFIDPDTNETYKEGQYVKRLRFAKTLEIIAVEQANALYSKNGSLIGDFVKDIQDHGGIIQENDLLEYEPIWEEPVKVEFNDGHILYTASLPGSGGVLAFILNILDGFLDLEKLYNIETFQRIVESFKFAYGHRTKLGDPNNNKSEDIKNVMKNLTSKTYAEEIRNLIFDNETSLDPTYYGAEFQQMSDHGTAHISIIAPNGDAISVTSTINFIFGAGFASSSTGIILNNEMDDFSLPDIVSIFATRPSPSNSVQPGMRPLSSMVPTIILKDKDVVLVTGAAGGTKITTVVASVILKHMWYGVDLQEAVTEKRLHHQLIPMNIEYEEGFNLDYPDLVTNLSTIHNSTYTPTANGFSALTAITTKEDTIKGVFDIRRGGYISYLH